MKYEVRVYPDPLLRQSAKPVEVIDPPLRELAEVMTERLYEENGVGLAAPQIGVSLRIIVVDVSPTRDSPVVYINPELERGRERDTAEEGCLSVPGIQAEVERPATVRMTAQTLDGEEVTVEAEGLLARCLQHEVDHLDGILFIDKITPSERFRVRESLWELEEAFRRA